MGLAKRRAKLALAKAASASAEATPKVYVQTIAEDYNHEAEQILIEGANPSTRVPVFLTPVGKNHSFNFPGIEASAENLGYLWWLAMGSDSWAGGTHTLTLATLLDYFNSKLDDGLDKGSSTPTESLVGCKVGRIATEIAFRSFARTTLSGLACDYASAGAALSPPSLSTAADDAPLSFPALQAVGGLFQVGYNGAGVANNVSARGFSVELTHELDGEGGTDYDADQPTEINEDAVGLNFSFDQELNTAAGLAAYNAFKSEHEVAIKVKGVMGAATIEWEILHAYMTKQPRQPVGTGPQSMMQRVECRAFKSGSDPLMTMTVVDDYGSAYS